MSGHKRKRGDRSPSTAWSHQESTSQFPDLQTLVAEAVTRVLDEHRRRSSLRAPDSVAVDDSSSELSDPPEYLSDEKPTSQESEVIDDTLADNKLIANRTAYYLRTRNNDVDFQPQDILELPHFNAEHLIQILTDQGAFGFDERVIRGIFRDPRHYRYGAPPQARGAIQSRTTQSRSAQSWTLTGTPVVRTPLPIPDKNHPTHQKVGEGETVSLERGKWYVIFKRSWTSNGKKYTYRQKDELPIFDEKAKIPKLPANEKETYIQHPGKLPTFSKFKNGHWEKIKNNGALGKWCRTHDNPKKGEKLEVVEPKLIARKFHRFQYAYLEQYKMAGAWEAWEKHVEAFDINNAETCRNYNRWIQQLLERNHFEYEKREYRPCWTKGEIEALRCHFNDLINEHGLIKVHLYPEWRDAIAKVNDALYDSNPETPGPRNENAVSSFAERDIYANDIPRLGIHEWREFGKKLWDLQKTHPSLDIPKNVIYPRKNPIPMDDIQTKEAGGHQRPSERRKMYNPRREKREQKLSVELINDRVVVTDRFGGKLVEHFGLMDHAEEDDAKPQIEIREEQDEGDNYGDGDGDSDGDGDEERPRKKCRRGKK